MLEIEAPEDLRDLARNGLRKIAVRGPYRGIRRYRQDSRDKVSTDNSISVPLDNSIINLMRQTGVVNKLRVGIAGSALKIDTKGMILSIPPLII